MIMQGEPGPKGEKGQSGPDGFQVSQCYYPLLLVLIVFNRGELGHEGLWDQRDRK